MADDPKLLALFEDVGPASAGITRLHELGLKDDQMEVISGIPFTSHILGKQPVRTHVPLFALGGAVLGIAAAVFFMEGTPFLYMLHVGGQPNYPFPPLLVIGFELAMLGLMCGAFLGVFVDSRFPSDEPKEYVSEISDGKIAVAVSCPPELVAGCETALLDAGAEWARPVEAKKL